jgi:hypothetical protein
METTVFPSFSFPGGGVARKSVSSCLDSLEVLCKGEVSRERITDFCICQVYAIQRFDAEYLKKWNVSHSFGKKALMRFAMNNSRKKYYENLWLTKNKLSRQGLLETFKDKREHPLAKFIFPEYEEGTKGRLHNTDAGFYICQLSTLLYTPFSPFCQQCTYSERCISILQKKHGELFRIRTEEYNKR